MGNTPNTLPMPTTGPVGADAPCCLSCGEGLSGRRRRYCSVECRQRLRRKLDLRTGLLRALNTRYATFYITEGWIVLDLMPFDTEDIFSYIFLRASGRKPADDFSRLADLLGNAWWRERRQTQKKYLASRHVLEKAVRGFRGPEAVSPRVARNPTVDGNALVHLQLRRSDLAAPDLEKRIRSAYRQQAKRHHPDRGGNSGEFRKIHQAYRNLVRWAEQPVFSERRGFPDKWFYDGYRDRWVQPTPAEARSFGT